MSMRKTESSYVLVEFGPNVLQFDTADDAVAFAKEQGCEAVTYWPMWFTRAC